MRQRNRQLAEEVEQLRAERDRLERKNARLRERLDGPPDLSYLFLMTYGRSGSTLVTGLLNALPGYLIRGENEQALHHLFAYHRQLAALKRRKPAEVSGDATHPFFGMGDVPLRRSLAGARRLALETVLRPEAGTRVSGFKEIRWYDADMEQYVDWLGQVFPGARFLVNTRAHPSVLASGWWAKGDPVLNAASLAEAEERILAVADGLGESAYRVHYDDYVADPTVLRGLYDWLGEPWDEASVRATMAVRHSV